MNVFVVGKDARFQLLRELTHDSTVVEPLNNQFCKTHTAILSNHEMGLVEEGTVVLKSRHIPLHTAVWFPKDDMVGEGKILVVQEFPVGDQESMERIAYFQSQCPANPLEILLYYNNRTGLETDLNTEWDALWREQKRLTEAKIPAYVYRKGEAKPFLYWGVQSFLEVAKMATREKIATIRDELESWFPVSKEMAVEDMKAEGLLDSIVFQNMARYHASMNCVNLRPIFAKRGEMFYFKTKYNQAILPLLKQYEDSMETVLQWNRETDLKILEQKLVKKYIQKWMTLPVTHFAGNTEVEYLQCLDISKFDVQFGQMVTTFFQQDVWDVLQQHMEKRLQQVEEMIV